MKVTFHRAIDMTKNPLRATKAVLQSGCDMILTSGGAATVINGTDVIRKMVAVAHPRVVIIAAGGVTEDNAVDIVNVGAIFFNIKLRWR